MEEANSKFFIVVLFGSPPPLNHYSCFSWISVPPLIASLYGVIHIKLTNPQSRKLDDERFTPLFYRYRNSVKLLCSQISRFVPYTYRLAFKMVLSCLFVLAIEYGTAK
jgi:hypothetical protein